jgi:hypothetical protein
VFFYEILEMKTIHFPYIAAGLGLCLLFIVTNGSQTGTDGATLLPLLTLLVVSEFCFIVNAIACYIGIKHILASNFQARYVITTITCLLLAIRFLIIGLTLWPL